MSNSTLTSEEIREILSHVDHTELRTTASWNDIRALCDDAIRFQTATVCIPPAYVQQAKEYVGSRMRICTVIGFPNGYSTTAVKAAEAADAVHNGADEVDMVINLGWVKDRRWSALRNEIDTVKAAAGEHILKVIVETCALTPEERVKMAQIVDASSADFIKTSTGFSTAGATFEDIKVFADTLQ
ncbi:MAG: deoxyribose-phosphate aldolase, partial [Oscillospiraceae bacterium]|nr:deoxyribose-phosphate aldolase [Oscillospiraceae bacterium]